MPYVFYNQTDAKAIFGEYVNILPIEEHSMEFFRRKNKCISRYPDRTAHVRFQTG